MAVSAILDVLLDLPRLVALSILNEYLTWRIFIHLDNAYCNTIRRTPFLELLSAQIFGLNSLPIIKRDRFKGFMEWAVDRYVKLSKLVVIAAFRQIKAPLRDHFFDFAGSFLIEISFSWTMGSVDPILALVSKHCPNLQRLALWFCALSKHLRNVFCGARQLKSLRLHECTQLRPSYFTSLVLPNLESVITADAVGPETVRAMCAAAPNIVRLQMPYNTALNDTFAVQTKMSSKQLIALNFSHCKNLTDVTFVIVFYHCTQIREVDISGCRRVTDVSLKALTKFCLCVTKLLIQHNPNITSLAMQLVSQAYPASLKVLFISDCAKIGNMGLTTVCNACTTLTALDIGMNKRLDPPTLLTVPLACRLLCELVLSELTLSDDILHSVSDNCRSLKLFHIFDATGFSSQALFRVVTNCKLLTELMVSLDETTITESLCYEMRSLRVDLSVITEHYMLGNGVLDGPHDSQNIYN